MKKLYFLCTRPWIYLTTLPLIAVFVLAIIYNGRADGIWKLYPLIITSALGIVAIFVYFFKFLTLTTDELATYAVFLSRDKAVINKDKTLIIGKESLTRIRLDLFGRDDEPPALDWVRDDESFLAREIYLFRSKVLGGVWCYPTILKYFGVPSNTAKSLAKCNGTYEDDAVYVSSEGGESGTQEIRITFKKTI